jgi:hypothetical protein
MEKKPVVVIPSQGSAFELWNDPREKVRMQSRVPYNQPLFPAFLRTLSPAFSMEE